MGLLMIRDDPVGASDGSSFGVGDGDDSKCGVDSRTSHITSQRVDCWIYGDDFVSSKSREH